MKRISIEAVGYFIHLIAHYITSVGHIARRLTRVTTVQRTCKTVAFFAWFVLVIAVAVNASAQETTSNRKSTDSGADSDNGSWYGFGHSQNWNANLRLDSNRTLNQVWKIKVGDGYSQIVGNQKHIFVASGDRVGGSDSKKIASHLTCYKTSTGAEVWRYSCISEMYGNHQTFGGKKPSPRSTPLLVDDRIVFSTFSGELICLDIQSGNEIWKKSTRKEFQAQAVQFGTSSSAMRCPHDPSGIVVMAAGEAGGLIKFNIESGAVVWRCPIATFGYATPVLATLGGQPQWIVVSRNAVVSADSKKGKTLWRYQLQESGLTNVPTPLIVDGSKVIVSCQGTKGTECIKVTRKGNEFIASQAWFNARMQFFYTNWLNLNDSLIASCTENYLTVFRNADGKRLGKWRGFGDGNVLLANNHLIALSGKGELSILRFEEASNRLSIERKHKLDDGRYWVAPSVIDDKLFVRFADQLICLSFDSKSGKPLPNLVDPNNPQTLDFKMTAMPPNPVEQIFEVFQTKGKAAALKLYEDLRNKNSLNEQQRIQLALAAQEQGMKDIATKLLADAQKDFPNSELIRKTVNKTKR